MRLPALFRTSVFQLTLIYITLFGVSVAALFVFMYWSTVGFLERQTNEVIDAEITGLDEQYQRSGLVGLVDVLRERVRRPGQESSVYLLVDAALRPLAGNMTRWPPQFDRPAELVEFSYTDANGVEIPVRARVMAIRNTGFRLLVGREIRELVQLNQMFKRAAIWGVALTLALALVGGVLVGVSAQQRIAQLNRTTRQIIAGDLSKRVPLSGFRDEHEELAVNVNAMLDQIESLLAGIRHVGDSIAHDLRGPLTRLRSRLEMLAGEATPSRASLEECITQADALLATFNALLRIARVESGAYRSAFAEVDLSRVVRDVCDLYRAAAEDAHLRLSCDCAERGLVFGDRELLAQAMTNLLDNAIKYTPAGGRIDVRLTKDDRDVRVTVSDTGPGIAPADRERVLARFTRLDQARSKPGNGLGLTLVRAVALQHDGELTLADNAPGLVVSLRLPLATAAQRDNSIAPGLSVAAPRALARRAS
jgi:signal transduction histidine kinase